jgi:hypothetical protein
MTEFSKVAISPGWRGLHLLRPRFVYLWVRVQAIPIPIVLFAPLVLLELFLRIGLRALCHSKGHPPQVAAALKALRGQTWQLRKLPPFALLELEVKPKASQAKALQQVCIRVGLW